jgi:hypothetical protein
VRRGGGCVCFVSTALHSSYVGSGAHSLCVGLLCYVCVGGDVWWRGVDVQSEIEPASGGAGWSKSHSVVWCVPFFGGLQRLFAAVSAQAQLLAGRAEMKQM